MIIHECTVVNSVLYVKALDTMLRKASEARVNRRLRRYYLIVRLLPNVFALFSLSSFEFDIVEYGGTS